MDQIKQARPFIESKLTEYGIEWINKGRVSDDFKLLIYGRPNNGKQIGLYGRKSTILRLEEYSQTIAGIEVLDKCAKSDAAQSEYSNFRGQDGICVKVYNTLALGNLLDWYFQ